MNYVIFLLYKRFCSVHSPKEKLGGTLKKNKNPERELCLFISSIEFLSNIENGRSLKHNFYVAYTFCAWRDVTTL